MKEFLPGALVLLASPWGPCIGLVLESAISPYYESEERWWTLYAMGECGDWPEILLEMLDF